MRERHSLAFIDSTVQDLRFALRLLGKHRGFTTVAVLTLALGLGTTTAVFTIGNRLVFGPIPGVVSPEEVVLFHTGYPSQSPGAYTVSRVSYPNYIDIAQRLQTIRVAGMQGTSLAVSDGRGFASSEPVGFVTPSFFDVLGVRMQIGTPFFGTHDDQSSPILVAVISDALWSSRFNRDPAIVGRSFTIAGLEVSIVGVTERGFRGPFRTSQELLWLPGASYPVFTGQPSYDNRARGGYYQLLTRRHPGASWEQAQAELNGFVPWLVEQYPAENKNLTTRGWAFRNLGSIDRYGRGSFIPILSVMAGVASLVLLLTCANVAGLLLIRGVGRFDETGVRMALGAGRWRIMRQHLTEGIVLWVLGAVVGAGIVWALSVLMAGTDIAFLRMRDARVAFDWRVAGFATATSLVIGLLFSALPAWRAVRSQAWRPSSHGSTQHPSRLRAGTVLVATQLGTSLALLLGALLLTATVRHLRSLDVGVDSSNLTAVQLRTRDVRDYGVAWQYYQALSARASALPGVKMVALSETAPIVFGGTAFVEDLRPAESDREAIESLAIRVLSPVFFETLGIPLRAGRAFHQGELLHPPHQGSADVVVSESLARALFGTLDVVGRVLQSPRLPALRRQIVGVAGDVRVGGLTGEPDFVIYTPRLLTSAAPSDAVPYDAVLLIRETTGRNLSREIREAGRSINAAVPLDRVVSFEQALAQARMEWDVLAWLLTTFSLVACGLAALGVYGMLAFAVASRQRELGIRMALGASTARIRGLVARSVMPILVGGLLLGGAGAAGLTQILRSRLVGVQPFDPIMWISAAAGLIFVTIAASLIPARRATRVNVAETLRSL